MALAWITSRSPVVVRSWCAKYRHDCYHWVFHHRGVGVLGPHKGGYFVQQYPPATVILMRMSELMDGSFHEKEPPHIAVEAALTQLWQVLARGGVHTTAVDCRTNERVAIPDAAWPNLEASGDENRDTLRNRTRLAVGCSYENITFSSADLRKVWPVVHEPGGGVPPLLRPEKPGYTPLFCAAHWIASRGGDVLIDWDPKLWQDAYTRLLERVCADEIAVIGTQNGPPEPIEGYTFAGCRIAYPFEDHWQHGLPANGETKLFSCPYVDDVQWFAGLDDSLRNQDGPLWSKIMVRKEHVTAIWPFGLPAAGGGSNAHRSGAPGRPSSIQYVEAELEARQARGETLRSLTLEADALADWLSQTHPTAPRMAAKTIKNKFRALYRELEARPK